MTHLAEARITLACSHAVTGGRWVVGAGRFSVGA